MIDVKILEGPSVENPLPTTLLNGTGPFGFVDVGCAATSLCAIGKELKDDTVGVVPLKADEGYEGDE